MNRSFKRWGLRAAPLALFVAAAVLPLAGQSAAPAATGTKAGEWPTYGGDLASTRYSPLDQINATNFNKLEVAWRFKTDNLGPRPEFQFQSTPLMVKGMLYSTAGTRRAVVALDAATGEMLWMHSIDEGKRGAAAPRQLSGRGLVVLDRRQGGAHPLRHARLPAGRARREDRPARRRLRQERHRRSEAGRSIRRSISSPARSACTPRPSSSKNVDHHRRRAPGGRRAARARPTRRATSAASTCAPASACGSSTPFRARRVRQRHVGEGLVDLHRQHRRLGADERRRGARPRLPAGRAADRRLLRRPSSRATACSARASSRVDLEDRQAQVALPARAPRHLGPRHPVRADPGRPHRQRQDRSRPSRSRPSRAGSTCSIA